MTFFYRPTRQGRIRINKATKVSSFKVYRGCGRNHYYYAWPVTCIITSASHDLRLGKDGSSMFLALCDHGFERSG